MAMTLNQDDIDAIASAVRNELAVELARVDVAVSTRFADEDWVAPDNAGISNTHADLASLETTVGGLVSSVAATHAAVLAASTGAGSIPWTYTLTATGGAPIADAEVWVTSDLGGAYTVASGRTDDFGVVQFMLDAGTYYIWAAKAGWDFASPDTETVA
jgi:hypothetical protein